MIAPPRRTALALLILLAAAPPAPAQRLPSRSSYGLTVRHKDLEFQADDDVKVRTEQPPPRYDEKGKPKAYTFAERKELRGPDPKLPGYTSDFDELKNGQIVKVTLGRKKERAKDDKARWVPGEELVGVVQRVQRTSKKFVVRVDYRALRGSPGGSGNSGKKKETVPDKVLMIVILAEGTGKAR